MSVCLLAYVENHTAELRQIFEHVACGRGSVLFGRKGKDRGGKSKNNVCNAGASVQTD